MRRSGLLLAGLVIGMLVVAGGCTGSTKKSAGPCAGFGRIRDQIVGTVAQARSVGAAQPHVPSAYADSDRVAFCLLPDGVVKGVFLNDGQRLTLWQQPTNQRLHLPSTPPASYWTARYWDNPLYGVARDVDIAQARTLGRLAFAPLVPRWSVPPRHVLVLRGARAPAQPRLQNRMALLYRLPRSWGFGTSDTRLLVFEAAAPPGTPNAASSGPPGRHVRLGRHVTGALTEGHLPGFMTGELFFQYCRAQIRVLGPAATPEVVLRVGRDLVAAAPKCPQAH